MGKLLPKFKKALLDDMFYNIDNGNSVYYAFASHPVAYPSSATDVGKSDFLQEYEFDWSMMFGKKLNSSNFAYIVKNNTWTSGTVYDKYDNTDETLYDRNKYYVIVAPDYPGGDCLFYKCIDNNNGGASTIKPTLVQFQSFKTSDNYIWRYLGAVTYRQYSNFATSEFVPVFNDRIIASYANLYAGVEKVVISNAGKGYSAYHDGVVQFANSSAIQIEAGASIQNDIYKNSGIYVYNVEDTTSQLFTVTSYVSNSAGKWAFINSSANVDNITPGRTKYKISPGVVFETDGNTVPLAYSVVDYNSNTISNINIIDPGSDISWANVKVTSTLGSGCNLYAIVPPAGGHGSDTISELNVQGIAVYFEFANTESSTIPIDVLYNKIGIIKNPYSIVQETLVKGSAYTNQTFNQLLKAHIISPSAFIPGETVRGISSGAKGIVAYSNTSEVYIVGDKRFANLEYIVSSNGSLSTQINVYSYGSIYGKDIKPLYVQNINNVNRSNSQSESFKLIIQV